MKQFVVLYKSALDQTWKFDKMYSERRYAEMRAELESIGGQKHIVVELEIPVEEPAPCA